MTGKVFKIAIWIVLAAWFVVIIGFVSAEADKILCNRIEVTLTDTVHSQFVTTSDVRDMLEKTNMHLQGYPLEKINIRTLEGELEQNPYVKNAEVNKDVSGRLSVKVEQRVPQVRILPEGRLGFYMDREGVVLPLSDQFTPLILLASGHIPYPEQDGSSGDKLREIHRFGSYLAEHPFWGEQIVQIYVNSLGEYELIPRVGAHHILFGSMEQWKKKLRNLELLYRQGFSKYGWNSYRTINLKYTNQVICTKR